jgi:threonine synthase
LDYRCTRNEDEPVSAARAIVQGISADGGLFVPESFPQYTKKDLDALKGCSYEQRAVRILADFLPEFSRDEIRECVSGAYSQQKFPGGPAPLVPLEGTNAQMLELWHGPTCAFKDMALQLLPHLLTRSLKKIGSKKTAVILVATSGDTGKAALEGFRDVAGTRILVFYPENGVSPMQKRQMTTQEGGNVGVCAIKGNFDDAQTGVKKIFIDPATKDALDKKGMLFSSANSINWGRLLPQIVYYFSAYCDLMKQKNTPAGEPVNIVVPTGNFGNILAAYYAKKMGLPVKKLICASNSNNVLTDFLKTGVYDRNRRFYTTISPSMDILVSSNLERLLFDLTGGDSGRVSGWMQELARTGRYRVDEEILSRIGETFYSGFCDDDATRATIRRTLREKLYLCDTHTAVAVNVYGQYARETGDNSTPAVIASTASPYKFADSVLEAVAGRLDRGVDDFEKIEMLSSVSGTPVPAPIEALRGKAVRFRKCCAVDEMPQAVLEMAGLGGRNGKGLTMEP